MTESDDERFERLSRDRIVKPLPKRFYKEVTVSPDRAILLDGRTVKTPLKQPLILPTQALAEAVAAEWQGQGEHINPHAMPLTKLANTAIDRAAEHAEAIRADILAFAGHDLVCYRESQPDSLVNRQSRAWEPVLAWAADEFGAPFETTRGLHHVEQPQAAMAAVAQRLAGLGPFVLVAVHTMTTLSGSALIALMVASGTLTAEQGWAASNVEEDYQKELWGQDAEAEARAKARAAEFTQSATFINLTQDCR